MKNTDLFDFESDKTYKNLYEFLRNGAMKNLDPDRLNITMDEYFKKGVGTITPDMIAADLFFVDSFITPDMEWEFNLIANDFLKHHFTRLNEFDSLVSHNNSWSYQSDPYRAFQRRIMNIMYNAARADDPYAVELLCYLYKSYHKKEYNAVKKFSKISFEELYALSRTEEEISFGTMARILGMCILNGVKLDGSCFIAYFIMRERMKELEKAEEVEFFEFKEGLVQECMDQVDFWLEDAKRKSKTVGDKWFYKATKEFYNITNFVGLALQHEGYPYDFLVRCDDYGTEVERTSVKALALLKSAYPDRDFDFKEVQQYTHLLIAIEALVCVCNSMDNNLDELLGLSDIDPEEYEDILFHPEKIKYREEKDQPEEKKTIRPINIGPVSTEPTSEQNLIEEIEELRKRIADKEREYKNLKMQYNHVKSYLSEADDIIKKYERDHDELIALRNAMYKLSEEVEQVEDNQSTSLEDMQVLIAKKQIIIIGGNDNWIKKIRQSFSKWTFISANVSGTLTPSVVQKADKVYFFTDVLAHSNYYRYLQTIRECGIPFGYLHGVNLQRNITDIYNDLVE